jgi:hypothetical protein
MKRGAWLGYVLWLAACASAPTRAPVVTGPAQSHDPSWTEAADPLSVTMRGVAERLEPTGLKPSTLTLRSFVAAGDRHSFPLTLPAHTCATLVALASAAVADIDAALYAPDGELLGVDAQPDAHPTLQVCALDAPRLLYYVLHAYDGAGTVLMVGFVGPRDSVEAAARVLGGQPALARGSATEVDQLDRIASFSDAVRRRGFATRAAPLGVPLEAGQAVRVRIGVRAGSCYTAAGFAEAGLTALDLRVLDDEGSELGADHAGLDSAAAQFCTDRSADYAVELASRLGAGRAQLLLYEVEASALGGERGLWLGDEVRHTVMRQELDSVLAGTLAQARSDGYGERVLEQRGRLGPGEVQEHALRLPAAGCSRVVLQGGRGLGRLELRAHDGSGHELARAVGQGGSARLHLCPPAQELRVQVTALGGQGAYALLVLGAAQTDSPALLQASTGDGPDRGSSLELEQQAREAGFTAIDEFRDGPQRVDLAGDTAQARIGLPLAAGHCLRVYALTRGEGPVTARFDHDGQSITASALPGEPLRVCAESAAARTLQLSLSAAKQASVWLWAFDRAAPTGSPLRL